MLLGFLFGFLFGLRVSGVVYMGYCVMRYCWWHAVLQVGGDGCHNSFPTKLPENVYEILPTKSLHRNFPIRFRHNEYVLSKFSEIPGCFSDDINCRKVLSMFTHFSCSELSYFEEIPYFEEKKNK